MFYITPSVFVFIVFSDFFQENRLHLVLKFEYQLLQNVKKWCKNSGRAFLHCTLSKMRTVQKLVFSTVLTVYITNHWSWKPHTNQRQQTNNFNRVLFLYHSASASSLVTTGLFAWHRCVYAWLLLLLLFFHWFIVILFDVLSPVLIILIILCRTFEHLSCSKHKQQNNTRIALFFTQC